MGNKREATLAVVIEEMMGPHRADRGPLDPVRVKNVEIASANRGRLYEWEVHSLDVRGTREEDPTPKNIWTADFVQWNGDQPAQMMHVPGHYENQQLALDALVAALATRTETVRTEKIFPPPWTFRDPFDALLSPAVRGYSVDQYHELLDSLCDLASGRTS